jgi:choline dehydrogenase
MGAAYLLRRDGLMSTPGVTAHAYAAIDTDELQPAIKLQLHHLSSANERDPKRLELDAFPGFSIGFVHQQPTSVGSVHLSSADVAIAPRIVTNHLSTPEDLRAYIAGFRLARKVIQQPAFADIVVEEVRPGPRIDTDDEIEAYLRQTLFSSYHPTGTCRMGANDGAHVVDHRLRVHGLAGIRVADASIMPTIPSSNTNAPAIMIGEKAAEMVLQDLSA